MQNKALVLGAGGFIGSNLVKRLKSEGYWVRGVDLKYPEYSKTEADDFVIGDLRSSSVVSNIMISPDQNLNEKGNAFTEVYSLASQMGGAGYIFSKENDADIIHDSAQIHLNVSEIAARCGVKKLLFSSSACCYPESLQTEAKSNDLRESDAWKDKPDSVYGVEKLFSEQVYDSFRRNKLLNVRICRFHNIFGEESCYDNGREKFPAAISRKVAEAKDGDSIEIWGTGTQVRSFLHIQECLDGVRALMNSEYYYPVNIGSSESISINDLAKMVIGFSGKKLTMKNVESNAIGVMGRNSNNELCLKEIGWAPSQPLSIGMQKLYTWVNEQVKKQKDR